MRVGTDADQNPILRSYSIASPPERWGELALVLRLVSDGIGSRYFDALRIGESITFTGPMGFFVNELAHSGDVVYIATGTGIAPLLPMIEETLRRSETGRVILFWGLRSEADVFYQDELNALSTRTPRFTYQIYLAAAGFLSPARARDRAGVGASARAARADLLPVRQRPDDRRAEDRLGGARRKSQATDPHRGLLTRDGDRVSGVIGWLGLGAIAGVALLRVGWGSSVRSGRLSWPICGPRPRPCGRDQRARCHRRGTQLDRSAGPL